MPRRLPDNENKIIGHVGLDNLDDLSNSVFMKTETFIPKWPAIESAAIALGVAYSARRKWLQRGSVPHKWRLPILLEARGAVAPNDFLLPAPPHACHTATPSTAPDTAKEAA